MEFAPWNDIDGVSDDWQNYPVTNITFQDSMIADPTGQQFGAHTESVSSDWSWYRNIFANSHNRNPLAKVNNVFVNNVLYNYSAGYTTHTSTNFTHDIVNNYFIFGPASTGTDNTWYQVDKNQSIYYAGNLKDSNLNGTLDGTATTPYWYQGTGTVLTSPWSTETTATPPLDTASGGAGRDLGGGDAAARSVDALIISQVMTLGKGTTGSGASTVGPGGGLYTSQADTGLPNNGYGTIAGGTRPTDTDNDGMPDVWESANGSNVNANDAMTKAADGYALVEHYINWLAGPHAQTAAGAVGQLRSLQLRGGVQQRLADLRRLGRAKRNGHAGGGQAHRAVPADRRVPRDGVFRLHGDRLGRHRVHEPGVRARDAEAKTGTLGGFLRPPAKRPAERSSSASRDESSRDLN